MKSFFKNCLFITCLVTVVNSYAQNVGVGNTTPLGKLHIKGSDNISQLIIDASSGQSNLQPLIRLRKATGINLLDIHSDDSTNVFMGLHAGRANIPASGFGIQNTFVGSLTGFSNTTGRYNTSLGSNALYTNTTGGENTAIGFEAMRKNISGSINTAVGKGALYNLLTGTGNTAVGNGALYSITSANYATAIGVRALYQNTSGYVNTALGYSALEYNTTGYQNVALGAFALNFNVTGYQNIATGNNSLYNNSSGYKNTSSGYNSMFDNLSGYENISFGFESLRKNISGRSNTAVGADALRNNTTGNYNTAIGDTSLFANIFGSNNTAIGYKANVGGSTLNNATAIGANASVSTSNSLVLGSIQGVNGATSSANVGIGTSAPNTSAALDVTSTTKGLLPPRMTVEQRDAIVSPAAGLFIWCTNCGPQGAAQIFNGVNWTTLAIVIPPIIGQTYQGGIVAYLLQSGDPGYDPNVPHGLIAAPTDQSTNSVWWNGTYTVTGATGTALGTGQSNTTTIVTNGGGYAAQLCNDLVLYGYSDWYLPSKDELNKLYLNRVDIGGFSTNSYWSSSEIDITYAWVQYFTSGSQSYGNKGSQFYVRAVRAF